MSDLNKVIITGRWNRDSELRETKNGTAVTELSVASNRIWSKAGDRQEEATFVDVTPWGKQAESLSQYLTKGRHVMIEGRLKLNSWETDEGVKRNKLTVVAENINLTPSGGGSNGGQQSQRQTAAASQSSEEDMPF